MNTMTHRITKASFVLSLLVSTTIYSMDLSDELHTVRSRRNSNTVPVVLLHSPYEPFVESYTAKEKIENSLISFALGAGIAAAANQVGVLKPLISDGKDGYGTMGKLAGLAVASSAICFGRVVRESLVGKKPEDPLDVALNVGSGLGGVYTFVKAFVEKEATK